MSSTLDGAWQKLERAKRHVDDLRDAIREAGHGDTPPVTVGREYIPQDQAVVYRIERIMQIGADWSLLTGDALHNFRCALDHAWWELACRHLTRTPTEEEAKRIQFPILKPGGTWDTRNHIQLVGKDAAKLAGAVQPDYSRYPNEIDPLGVLRRLSNEDKHRSPHIAVTVVRDLVFTNTVPDGLTDCVTDPRPTPQGMASIILNNDMGNPSPGDEVLRVLVRPTGPNPDIDLKAKLSGYVAIAGTWNLLETLDGIDEGVTTILTRIAPLL
jgi:hypothetical protein